MTEVDRAALSELVHRYAARVDDRDFAGVADLFTEDAELILPDPPERLDPVSSRHGRAGVRAALATLASVTRTRHAIVGEVYDAAGPDAGTGRVACVAHHFSARGDGFTDLVWHLRYDDAYRREDDGWRIARRALTIDAIETGPIRRLRI